MFHDDKELQIFQQVVSGFDTPAFLRRAKRVEDAWNLLIRQCSHRYDEWLEVPKLRLATLAALAGDWMVLDGMLTSADAVRELRLLFDAWQPRLRLPVARTSSPRKLSAALRETHDSFARFNRRWEQFVHERDLTEINQLRAGYNKYYVLEKECMVRSAKTARQGFVPLPTASAAELFAAFPLLNVPPVRQS